MYGLEGKGWDLVGGPNCLGKMVEEVLSLLALLVQKSWDLVDGPNCLGKLVEEVLSLLALLVQNYKH